MMDLYFDASAKDAVDVVLSDSIKDKDAYEKDTKFIPFATFVRVVRAHHLRATYQQL